MANFVLIHGAFRGGWAWDRVVPLLAARGHNVIANDLPASGERWAPDHDAIGLDDYVNDIVASISGNQSAKAVIVGHSQGGFVARAAVERTPDLFEAIGYLDAPIPINGLRGIDLQSPEAAGYPLPPFDRADEIAPRILAEEPGLGSDDAEWINQRLTPQPVGPSLEPLSIVDPVAAAIPSFVAFCSMTPPMYPAWYTRSKMDASDEPYTLIDAPHDAPVARPEAVAAWLLAGVATQRT